MAKAWCKHYKGMHKKESCESGVLFSELPFYGTKEFHENCPCFGPRTKELCDKVEYPTAEELAEKEAWINARIEAIGKARQAIVAASGGKPGATGYIDCPACDGVQSLRYSVSGYNGHIHAACKTDGCVSWME